MATVTHAVAKLYTDVKAKVQAEAPTVAFAFGTREPSRHGRASRVVFVPGDDGKAGAYGAARNPGRQPRPLHTLNELVTVYCLGHDATAPRDQLAQYVAARSLHDAVIRAIYLSAHGTYELQGLTWVASNNELLYGAELRFVVSLQAMISDVPYSEVVPPAYGGSGGIDNDPGHVAYVPDGGRPQPEAEITYVADLPTDHTEGPDTI